MIWGVIEVSESVLHTALGGPLVANASYRVKALFECYDPWALVSDGRFSCRRSAGAAFRAQRRALRPVRSLQFSLCRDIGRVE